MKLLPFIVGLLLFLAAAVRSIHSQEPVAVTAPKVSVEVKADTLAVREAPPEQNALIFTTSPGKEITSALKGEKLTVIEEKSVKTLLEDSKWLKVKTTGGKEGWIYGGKGKELETVVIKEK